jgi:hypothetical protein
MAKLQRTTFEASRAAEYFDARQLSALTGVPREMFLNVCLKELGDNALDACETAAVAPEVSVTVECQQGELCRLSVSDNGPGMPSELIEKILDYNVRVSDKMAFQPYAIFSYQAEIDSSEGSRIYKSTHPAPFKKYVPGNPTSPHWYSPESLKVLVFSHIAHARNGGRDLPLGEFVRQFAGLTSTKKAKAVCANLPGFAYLSDFEENPDAVGELLVEMQAESKPPKAAALGHVGEEHFRTFFETIYEVKEFKYVRLSGTLPSGLPFTFEFALATLDEPGHLYCGINFSPTFGDPLEGTTLASPEFRAQGIQGFLSQAYALPKAEQA